MEMEQENKSWKELTRENQLKWNSRGVLKMNSFDDVANWYNQTKPLRGARASKDIRPLGKRAYWWKRIVKFDDNCYALSDGLGYTDDRFGEEAYKRTMPILWERRADGDYITIRNHVNGGISIGRYDFLATYLPKAINFWYSYGKHYVCHEGKDYFLPKMKANVDYSKNLFEITLDCKIVFKHNADGTFTHNGELQPYKTKRVDKKLKDEYEPHMRAMWDWMQVVLPMLGETIYDQRNEYAQRLSNNNYWYWNSGLKSDVVRRLLTDENDELRVAFAVCLANQADAVENKRFEPKKGSYQKMRVMLRRLGDMYENDFR